MNPELDIPKILADHKLWLFDTCKGARANLRGANLRGADLSNADLSSADLSSANLFNADLSNADLRYADLRYANLRYANLSGADLRYANLSFANLRYANLSGADLRYADLSDANLQDTLSSANTKDTPVGTKETNPKDAVGCTKPSLSVLPCSVLYEVAAALTEGACKYGRHNWRQAGVRNSIYYDAAMRHLMAWWEGEDTDPDSGLSHIAKAIAGLVVLRDAQIQDMVSDDRPPESPKDWLKGVSEKVRQIHDKYPNPLPPITRQVGS